MDEEGKRRLEEVEEENKKLKNKKVAKSEMGKKEKPKLTPKLLTKDFFNVKIFSMKSKKEVKRTLRKILLKKLYLTNDLRKSPFSKETKCPKCEKLLTYKGKFKTSRNDHKVDWMENTKKYDCYKCQIRYRFKAKSKVFYREDYYGLSASFYDENPNKRERQKVGVPDVPNWDKKCKICEMGLKYCYGDGFGAVTGASSKYATLKCMKCKLFYTCYEHDD